MLPAFKKVDLIYPYVATVLVKALGGIISAAEISQALVLNLEHVWYMYVWYRYGRSGVVDLHYGTGRVYRTLGGFFTCII